MHTQAPTVTSLDRAKAALSQARADYAKAVLARQDTPADRDACRRLWETLCQGKAAWRAYQDAATAPIAAQIAGIVPRAFRD